MKHRELRGRFADPIDAWVVADHLMERIDHYNLEPLVHSIRCDPIGIEDTETTTFTANALLCDAAEIASCLDLVDAAILWFSVDDALRNTPLAATTLHANAVDEIALLCLVTNFACLVWASRS